MIGKIKMFICCSYIVGSADYAIFSSSMHNIEQVFLNNPDAKFIVMGDFSLRNIKRYIDDEHKFDVIRYVDPDKLKATNILQSIVSLLNFVTNLFSVKRVLLTRNTTEVSPSDFHDNVVC